MAISQTFCFISVLWYFWITFIYLGLLFTNCKKNKLFISFYKLFRLFDRFSVFCCDKSLQNRSLNEIVEIGNARSKNWPSSYVILIFSLHKKCGFTSIAKICIISMKIGEKNKIWQINRGIEKHLFLKNENLSHGCETQPNKNL